jgi:N-acyl-D-amino-acid deacylase
MTGYDLAVENARVVDGTGAPWFRGAVAVEGDRIAAVSRAPEGVDAETVVDAGGNVVCPGFVDTHSHSDLELFADPALEPKLRQGITTEVVGQDGFSMAPVEPGDAAQWQTHLSGLAGDVNVDGTWRSIAAYLDAIDAREVGPNVATLGGPGTVRFAVAGMDDRAPTDGELAEMADLVTEGLEDGAVGFSTGLIYAPQVNADTAEVRALAERVAPFGRPFVAHIRSEGRLIWDALDEFVDVGAEAGVPLHLSHYKVAGSRQHGKAGRANALIETARERGVDFTAEQYPYTAGNTVLASVLPPWVQSGGPEATLSRLDDPDARERVRRDIEENRIEGWENPALRTGWENIVVRNVESPAWEAYEGRDLAAIADDRDQHPSEAVCDLLVAEELEVNIVSHAMAEGDVREIMANERVCVATDGLFGAAPHPRTYGTYPRVLGRYVREEDLLTLEEAVRKMTSLPARAMGFQRKGVLRPGADADLVVFDPDTVGSPATYDRPTRHPLGITHVVVNGAVALADGELTGERRGRALRA